MVAVVLRGTSVVLMVRDRGYHGAPVEVVDNPVPVQHPQLFASSVDAIPLPPPTQSAPVFHYTPREVRMLMEISRLRAETMFSPFFS